MLLIYLILFQKSAIIKIFDIILGICGDNSTFATIGKRFL